jgi:DNA-binding transcriptional regulator YhcF (GntR family)
MSHEASRVDGLSDSENEAQAGPGALAPLRRAAPMRRQVQTALRELIITRTYEPGQHLVESEVARRLQVSRLPVREALQALHMEGWLDLHVGRGAFVHVPTSREVNEVFAVRGSLEEEATRLTTPRITTAVRAVPAWPPETSRRLSLRTPGSTGPSATLPTTPCCPTSLAPSSSGCGGTSGLWSAVAAPPPGTSTRRSSKRWPPAERRSRGP